MDSNAQYIADQLRGLEGLRTRAMFGGLGLYQGEVFFAIFYRGRLYFRVDETTRSDYELCGMRPFTPPRARGKRPQTLASYFEVPEEILECAADAVRWAQRAVAAAAAAGKRSTKRRRR